MSAISPPAGPTYFAASGYGQRGRFRVVGNPVMVPCVLRNAVPVAAIKSGATPFSTQFTIDVTASKLAVAGPPEQWPMLGIGKYRAKLCTPLIPPFNAAS